MTIKKVYDLRRQGRLEEAYDAIRSLYAGDKSPHASLAMFWTAVDVLRARVEDGHTDDARKILSALERMLPNVPDKDGNVQDAFIKCQRKLENTDRGNMMCDRSADHLLTGIWGENLAAEYLREKGYIILERDWHSGHRDIDIIAGHDDYLVFIEVKTRRSAEFGDPIMAVDYKKRRNLRLAMNHYIRSRHIDGPVRFDIVTVVGTPGCDNPLITHLEDVRIMEPIYS